MNKLKEILKNKSKIVSGLVIGVIVLVVGIVAYNFPFPGNPVAMVFYPNLAEEVAKPIEKALVEAGAVKVCETGDKGFGIDNDSPWYRAYFETSLDRETVVNLIKATAKDNGHNLVQASPENRGYLSTADEFIHKWLFDDSNKQVNNPILTQGPVELSIGTENNKSIELSGLVCKTPTNVSLESDSQNTIIQIEVSLPNLRHLYFL